ncbi:MAG: hypothetical protein ACOCXG_04455 [Nanoarchaeota archaeon]
MEANYFDLETYSKGDKPDPKTDKIITIQFQKFDLDTGKPLTELQVLKEWEDGEEEIIKFVYKWFFKRNFWQFLPVGFNLTFEWQFLFEKFKQYGVCNMKYEDFFNIPQVDLKSVAVVKKGTFIGAKLSSISGKEDDGNVIKNLYEAKEYDKILKYIENEAESFLGMYRKLSETIRKNI